MTAARLAASGRCWLCGAPCEGERCTDPAECFARSVAPPGAPSLDALIADVHRRRAVEASLAHVPTLLTDRSRPDWRHLVSLDPSRPGGWRATRFEADEPVGHVECAGFVEAMREAVMRGADVDTARAVTAQHPAGTGACDPDEPACCDECAAAYSEADGDEESAENSDGETV